MRPMGIMTLFALLFCSLPLGISPVMAGESQNVINTGNNTPVEAKFSVNIHGNDPKPFFCKKELKRNAPIFRHKYSESTLQGVENKTADTTDLTGFEARTPSSSTLSDDLPAKVVLPYEGENAYSFSRVDSKPDKAKHDDNAGSILLSPKLIEEASAEAPTSHDDSLIKTGLSNIRNMYAATVNKFSKFRHEPFKEKSKPMDITGLFKLLGWFCQASVMDADEDGNVDAYALNFIRMY